MSVAITFTASPPLALAGGGLPPPPNEPGPRVWIYLELALLAVLIWILLFEPLTLAQTGTLPGSDASDKLEAAGTLLRLVDTALFKWGARLFAGLCIMSSAWSLKEQRFGIAIVCIIGALIFGTAPTWVRNIFAISSSDSVFGLVAWPVWWVTAKFNAMEAIFDA